MELVSLVLYASVATLSLVMYYLKSQFDYWKRRDIPHVEAQSPYGIFTGLRKKIGFYELFGNIYNKFKGTGPFAGIYMFTVPSVVLLDLDLIKNVLIKDFNNFNDRGLFYNERDDPLTAHLFALDAVKWRSLRTTMTPTFTSGKMKFMFPTIVSVGERFVQAFDREIKISSDIEVRDMLARFTTDVIGTCAFGIECNSLNNPDEQFQQMGMKFFNNPRNMNSMFFTAMFPKLSRLLRVKFTPPDITRFFTKTVSETVAYREENGIKRNDFMNLLIDLKNKSSIRGEGKTTLTMNEIITQAFVFFVAGFETSSTTVGFALYELARNPHLQDKLRQEASETLSRHGGELTYEGVKEMQFLDQIISETLRLYPTSIHLRRKANADYPTSDPKYTIPKNALVFIPIFGIQRDPEIYPNPEIFDPDRFDPEKIKKRHPMSWLSFGDGPRNCIGLRFGKMLVQVGLTMLIKNFRFSVTTDTPIPIKFHKSKFILQSEKGIVLNVERI